MLTPEKSLSDSQLPEALDKVINLLSAHNIVLNVLYKVADREVYRFIEEELMQEEIHVIDVPGMITHFTYEEFHPNDKEDLTRYTEEFIKMLISKDFEFMDHVLSSECSFRQETISSKEFIERLVHLLEPIEHLDMKKLTIHSINIAHSSACVGFQLTYKVKSASGPKTEHLDEAIFDFRHEMGYWYLQSITIPGLGI